MKGMKVTIFESRVADDNPGLGDAQSQWDDSDEEPGTPVPWGYKTYLEKILEWHGADQAKWMKMSDRKS